MAAARTLPAQDPEGPDERAAVRAAAAERLEGTRDASGRIEPIGQSTNTLRLGTGIARAGGGRVDVVGVGIHGELDRRADRQRLLEGAARIQRIADQVGVDGPR